MRRLSLLGAVLVLAAACSRSSRYAFPDISLPVLGGGKPMALRACGAAKCFLVYVTPWCPHCREATPHVLKLAEFLAPKNIPTRVIVGQDTDEHLENYARAFGPQTALDRGNEVPVNGVPHFFVVDNEGRLLAERAGFPPGYQGPASELAGLFGLP